MKIVDTIKQQYNHLKILFYASAFFMNSPGQLKRKRCYDILSL